MKVYQFGSSVDAGGEEKANDIDLIIVSDKPVDICLYSEREWELFGSGGVSDRGKRVVLHPNQGLKHFPVDRVRLVKDASGEMY